MARNSRRRPPRSRARKPDLADIRLLVLDVDGVMTDGGIYLDPKGRELKRFNAVDGAGIKYWQRAGREIAIISGRSGQATLARAAELGITLVRQSARAKLPVYEQMLRELKLRPAQVAVMGDDLPDVPMMRRCGFAIAPANATPEVLALAELVTRRCGGDGAVREAIEHILRECGLWETILRRYNLP